LSDRIFKWWKASLLVMSISVIILFGFVLYANINPKTGQTGDGGIDNRWYYHETLFNDAVCYVIVRDGNPYTDSNFCIKLDK
jgi:hypothetical protein